VKPVLEATPIDPEKLRPALHDNKFCDCAIVADADFVVTEDGHFDALNAATRRRMKFP